MKRGWVIVSMGICLLSAAAVLVRGQESLQTLQTKDAAMARGLLALGDEAFQGRKYVEAAEIYKLAAQGAQREGDMEVRAEALAQVARSYLIQGKKEAGRPWLEWAKEVASEEMPLGWSRYLGVRGRFEWQDNKLEKATKTFEEMYEYCLRHGLHSRAVDAAHMVAITASHEEQILWAQKGIAAAEEGHLEGWLGPLWNNLGWTYDEMGRHQEALDALIKAREYHWKVGDEHNKLVADWSVGHAYRMLEQLDEATNWLRPVLAWAERRYAMNSDPDAAEWVGHSYRELGQIAVARGELREGLDYLRRAKEKLAEAGMPEWDAEGFQQLEDSIAELAKTAPKKEVRPTVVHFEIPFEDEMRAISFYRSLFGWEIVEVPEMDYWMVNTVPIDELGQPLEVGINGGMMKRVVPYQWTINYVAVGSVDEYLRRAESLGGTVIRQKTPIPQMAWYAHVADTEGNVFGIIEQDPSAEW